MKTENDIKMEEMDAFAKAQRDEFYQEAVFPWILKLRRTILLTIVLIGGLIYSMNNPAIPDGFNYIMSGITLWYLVRCCGRFYGVSLFTKQFYDLKAQQDLMSKSFDNINID